MNTLTWNGGTGQIDDAKNWTPRVAPNEADTVRIWGGTVLAPGGSPPHFTIDMGRQDIAVQPTLVLQSGTIEAGVVVETALNPATPHASNSGVVANARVEVQGTLAVANGGFMEITGAVGAGQNAIVSSGMLVLDSAPKFEGGLYSFRGAGVVELKNTHITAASVSTTGGNLGLNLDTSHGKETIGLFGDAGKGPLVLNIGADSFLFADPTSGSAATNTNVDFAMVKAHTPYGELSADSFAHVVNYVPVPHLA